MPSPVSDTGGVTPSEGTVPAFLVFPVYGGNRKIKPGNYSSVISAVRQAYRRLLGTAQEEYFTQTWG